MDLKKIKAIIEMVKDSGINELEITEGEDRLKVTVSSSSLSHNTHSPLTSHYHLQPQHIPSQFVEPSKNVNSDRESSSNANTDSSANVLEQKQYINSPMVGTFYRSPSPEQAPFIEVGQTIKAGQVLCIIEAMKLMNQIEAEKDCQIVEILIKNGDPVGYGQPLFVIKEV